MATLGIDLREVESQAPGGVWIPPDTGVQTFEVTSITPGIQTKGEFAGEAFITAKCVQISGENPGTKTFSQFLGLSSKKGSYGTPLAQTKGILEAWGRYDIIEKGADADLDELEGTTFEAEVIHKTDKTTGELRPRLQKFVPVSHASLVPSEEAQAPYQSLIEPPQEDSPEPAPATAPPTMRRGR